MNFIKYSEYYDSFYEKKKYKKECQFISKILKLNKNDKLIDIGCGTGSHIVHFAKNCKEICGVDRSKYMLSHAKKKIFKLNLNKKVSFKLCDITKIRTNNKYDKAIILFHTLSYINNEKDLKNFFYYISKILKKGGLIVMDYWHLPAVLKYGLKKKKLVIRHKNLKVIRYTRPLKSETEDVCKLEFKISVFEKNNKKKEFKEIHIMKPFRRSQIEMYSNKYFKVLNHFTYFKQVLPKDNDWTAITILKKK